MLLAVIPLCERHRVSKSLRAQGGRRQGKRGKEGEIERGGEGVRASKGSRVGGLPPRAKELTHHLSCNAP